MDPLVIKKWTKGTVRDQASEPIDNVFVRNLLLEIAERNGWSYAGCWDVVGWTGERVVFFERSTRVTIGSARRKSSGCLLGSQQGFLWRISLSSSGPSPE